MSHNKLADIKMLISCVDGVLTNGEITYGSGNLEMRTFNVKDGLAMKLAVWNDFPVVWLTGRISNPVSRRADELDVRVYPGIADKEIGLRMAARDHGFANHEIAYIGDDINDIPAMEQVGFPIAVANAAPEVMNVAQYVTKLPGGQGAVREAIEFIFRAQGRWDSAVENYLETLRGTRISSYSRMPRTEE